MSLIQEALKRQQDESDGSRSDSEQPKTQPEPTQSDQDKTMQKDESLFKHPESSPVTGSVKPTSEEPAPAQKSKSGQKTWLTITFIIVFFVIFIVAVVYFLSVTLSYFGKKKIQKALVPIAEKALAAAATEKAQIDKIAPAGQDAGLAEKTSKPETGKKLTLPPPAVESGKSIPVLAQVQALKEAAVPEKQLPKQADGVLKEKAVTDLRTEPLVKSPEPAVVVPQEPMDWPHLKLTGVLSGLGPDRNAARINNKMIAVGGTIEGVTLIEVRKDGVVLKYGMETQFLRMGATLY